ncbi:MAG TPA: hypothetical protein VEF76_04400, partial [Patescibacteria group bacterium]|nr:hypothetical protein [Patescibacteria group bacterium]
MADTAAAAEQNRRFRRRAVWGIFVFALVLGCSLRMIDVLAWPALSAPLGPSNPDVWLRLAQLRQWLAGGDFFDHAIRNTNAPLGGV